jgi:FKBP-type peptidyl-prolyl cis-trans isomerase
MPKCLLAVSAVLGLLVVVGSCGGDSTGVIDPTDLEFDASLGVDLTQMTRTASGLYYQDLVVGDGAVAQAGDQVTVHYTGWLHDGTEFDSSVGGDPATFPLGGVIAGWQEGVPGMKVGGKRKLVIPPNLAYGKSGRGSIPGNATLVFDIDLIGVGG